MRPVILSMLLVAACQTPRQEDPDLVPPVVAETPQKMAKPTAATHAWSDGAGADWRYFSKRMSWEEAQHKCEILATATKRPWRLPSPQELTDALKKGISSSRNASFGWIYLNQTWTSTWENVVGIKVAVYGDMSTGKTYRAAVDHPMSALCVLTDEPGGNDWTDDKAGLIWRFVGDGTEWNGADRTCHTLARGDRLPWRLPSVVELEAAVRHGIQTDTNHAFGRKGLMLAWSGEANQSFGTESMALDLRSGNQYLMGRDQRLGLVCVRPQHH